MRGIIAECNVEKYMLLAELRCRTKVRLTSLPDNTRHVGRFKFCRDPFSQRNNNLISKL